MKRHSTIQMAIVGLFCAMALSTPLSLAHCEIPCGIYGDRMRVDMLREHFQTVEKSMRMIRDLEAADEPDANQLVRWVVNKDEHADAIQDIVYQYFMNQRIKPVDVDEDKKAYEKYVTEITLLHKMLVEAMKCKQTTDIAHVHKLQHLLSEFDASYFKTKEHHHE